MDRAQRILVVDDDDIVRYVLHDILVRAGEYEIVAARSAEEALWILRDEPAFGLIITDLRLDGLDGVGLTEQVSKSFPALPMIWITAHGCSSHDAEMNRLGIVACLEKPLGMQEIRQAVKSALAKRTSAAKRP